MDAILDEMMRGPGAGSVEDDSAYLTKMLMARYLSSDQDFDQDTQSTQSDTTLSDTTHASLNVHDAITNMNKKMELQLSQVTSSLHRVSVKSVPDTPAPVLHLTITAPTPPHPAKPPAAS